MNDLQIFAKKIIARVKIRRGQESLLRRMWWKFMPGVYTHMPWPAGPVNVENPCGEIYLSPGPFSADPNDHWRAWLEREVGKQGFAWDWMIGSIDIRVSSVERDTVLIKFRFDKGDAATAFKLKYGY